MGEDGKTPPASELIYVPRPSWVPAFMAFGIALVCVGLFAGSVYIVVGAIFALGSLIRWVTDNEAEISRMPVEQQTVTAVLPPPSTTE